MTTLDRRQRQIAKIKRALGGLGDYVEDIPDKPKWMRWATYDAKVAQIDRLESAVDSAWLAGAARLLDQF